MSTRRGSVIALPADLSGNPSLTAWQFGGALERLGYEVTLAGHASGPLWKPLEAELASAVRLRGLSGRSDVALSGDLVYAFKAMPASLGEGLRLARRLDVPLALHLDDWDAGFFHGRSAAKRLWWALGSLGRPNGIAWLHLFERFIPHADVLTVSSRALQRRFGGTLVLQGVDTVRVDPAHHPREEARRRLGVPATDAMVLFLGTPRIHKGLSNLLALPGLAESVWIVGMPPGNGAELALDGHLLGRAHVRPPVSFSEAAWYLAACDVFVVPQVDTLFAAHQTPAKILQAMAMGAAIVATDVGDAREILGSETPAGLVVPPDDPDALGGAIQDLLGAPDRRRALGGEARRRAVASYGWDAMGRQLSPLLAPVVGP